MFVVSMKTTRPRVLVTAAVVACLLVTMLILSGRQEALASGTVPVTDDAGRRAFLTGLGYEVDAAEAQVQEVLIPVDLDDTLVAYNQLQQEAGYDLSLYRGERVKCWTYGVTNYPGEEQAVARVYIFQNKVIGGDISSVEQGGFSHGLTPLQMGEG